MKLTLAMKDAIIASIMNDTPEEYSFDQCVNDVNRSLVYQFGTDKQMPELEKYIPKTPNLPVNNVIAELSKAGWSKGGMA